MRRFLLEGKYAAGTLDEVATGISNMVKAILGPILAVIGVAAVLYAIYLGVMYARLNQQTREKKYKAY